MTEQRSNNRQYRAAIIGAALLVTSGIIAIASSSTHRHGIGLAVDEPLQSSLSANRGAVGIEVASSSMRGSDIKQNEGRHNNNNIRPRRRQEDAMMASSTSDSDSGTKFNKRRSTLSIADPDPTGTISQMCSPLPKKECTRNSQCDYNPSSKTCGIKYPDIDTSKLPRFDDLILAKNSNNNRSNNCVSKSKEECKKDSRCELVEEIRGKKVCVYKSVVQSGSSGGSWVGGKVVVNNGNGNNKQVDACNSKNRQQCRRDRGCRWKGKSLGCADDDMDDNSDSNNNNVLDLEDIMQDEGTHPIKYWPKHSSDGKTDCIYSSDYPNMYSGLKHPILFDSYEQCCAAYSCTSSSLDVENPQGDALPEEPPTFFGDPMPRMEEPQSCTIGSSNASCPADQFCHTKEMTCADNVGSTEEVVGTCSPKPATCAEVYDPVCGCDDTTYSSWCHAYMAGVNVGGAGECLPKQPAPPSLPLKEEKKQPLTEELSCNAGEPCLEIGSTCSKGTESCCGQTYDSFKCTCGPSGMGDGQLQYNCYFSDACMAPRCCMSGPPLDKPPPAEGTCNNVGELCDTGIPDDYCCFDIRQGGGTYCSVSGGKEVAELTPPSLPSDEEKPQKCIAGPNNFDEGTPTMMADCPSDQYCKTDGSCGDAGYCTPKPETCVQMYDPVCGCDNEVYSNECVAFMAGVNVGGVCPKVITPPEVFPTKPPLLPEEPVDDEEDSGPQKCTLNSDSNECPSDQFCKTEGTSCGEQQPGYCTPKPEMCARIYNPVCGCNNELYSNECEAFMAGVNVGGVCPKVGIEPPEVFPVEEKGDAAMDNNEIPSFPDGPGDGAIAGMPLPTIHGEDPPLLDLDSGYDAPIIRGPNYCTSDTDCTNGLICHLPSNQCTCNTATNAGCAPGQTCGISPGLYCPMGGCYPTCSCNWLSNSIDGTNGCNVGEVCRMPCAMADAGVMCFKSEKERDCDVYGTGYVCRDGNGDGIIDGKDGGMGCERRVDLERIGVPIKQPRVAQDFEVARLVDGGDDVVIVDGADLYSSKPLDIDDSNMDHNHFATLRDCSSNMWHESTVAESHTCTNSVGDYPQDWTVYSSGEECCNILFHNAECHTVDVCEELLLLGEDLLGDAGIEGGMMLPSTIVPQQVFAPGWDETHTFATFSALEETAAASDAHDFKVFPGVETANGGHEPPLDVEDCSSVPWHVTDDSNKHTCTNSGDYAEGWETLEGYLFQTAMDCCTANFPDALECHLINVCEGNANEIKALSDPLASTTEAPYDVETIEACLSRPWHVTHGQAHHSCTNSGAHPADWTDEDLEDIMFYRSSGECCTAQFSDAECHIVDVCEEMFPSDMQKGDGEGTGADADMLTVDEPCLIENHCRSPSGHCGPHVTCEEDPCAVADCESGATCQVNSCGGCHAVCSNNDEEDVIQSASQKDTDCFTWNRHSSRLVAVPCNR